MYISTGWFTVDLWTFVLRTLHVGFKMIKYIFWEAFIQMNCISVPVHFDSWPMSNITCGWLASESPPHDFAFIMNATTCRLCRRPDGFPSSDGEHQYYGSHWRRPGTTSSGKGLVPHIYIYIYIYICRHTRTLGVKHLNNCVSNI